MPLPDLESPEPSLGDCAICMDAILIDPLLRLQSKSSELRNGEKSSGLSDTKKGKTVGNMINAMQIGVGVTNARKNYSLAPCSHLFVSFPWCDVTVNFALLTFITKHTDCLEKVCLLVSTSVFPVDS